MLKCQTPNNNDFNSHANFVTITFFYRASRNGKEGEGSLNASIGGGFFLMT